MAMGLLPPTLLRVPLACSGLQSGLLDFPSSASTVAALKPRWLMLPEALDARGDALLAAEPARWRSDSALASAAGVLVAGCSAVSGEPVGAGAGLGALELTDVSDTLSDRNTCELATNGRAPGARASLLQLLRALDSDAPSRSRGALDVSSVSDDSGQLNGGLRGVGGPPSANAKLPRGTCIDCAYVEARIESNERPVMPRGRPRDAARSVSGERCVLVETGLSQSPALSEAPLSMTVCSCSSGGSGVLRCTARSAALLVLVATGGSSRPGAGLNMAAILLQRGARVGAWPGTAEAARTCWYSALASSLPCEPPDGSAGTLGGD
jgi:hypothetical protein